ncbi:CrcB family protein [soil metagenome]
MRRPKLETTPAARAAGGKAPPASLPPLKNIFAVAAGGAIGATLRYSFIVAFPVVPGSFPLTIFTENIAGAFLLCLVLTLVLEHWRWRWDIRPFLTTGILGSFTTFSNLSLDIVALGRDGWLLIALGYSAASVAVGLLFAFLGIWVARRLARGRA